MITLQVKPVIRLLFFLECFELSGEFMIHGRPALPYRGWLCEYAELFKFRVNKSGKMKPDMFYQ